MQGKIITISRQCGSGGHSIGSELAKRLDLSYGKGGGGKSQD